MKQAVLMVRGVSLALALGASAASAQQVMWKDNPITGKVVGLTYGTGTWTAAEAQAVAYGGHLITIRDQAEQDWLAATYSSQWGAGGFSNGPWIGYTDAAQEGTWQWVDGAASTWTNWAQNEPNNQNDQDFANLGMGPLWRWDDGGIGDLRALVEVSQRPPRSWSWPYYTTITQPENIPYFGAGVGDFSGDERNEVIYIFGAQSRQNVHVYSWVEGSGLQHQYTFSSVHSVAGTWQLYDHDHDGKEDLIYWSNSGTLMKTSGSSAGPGATVALTDSNVSNGGSIFTFRDCNGDGAEDLINVHFAYGGFAYVSVWFRDALGAYLGLPDLSWSGSECSGSYILCNLDDDSTPEIIIASSFGGTSSTKVLKIQGNGSISKVADWPSSSALTLLSAPKESPCIVGLCQSGVLQVYRVVPVQQGPYGLEWIQSIPASNALSADIDGDGDLDLACMADKLRLYRRSASGYALDHIIDGGYLSADLNGDGKGDILSAFGGVRSSNNVKVVLNQSIFDCNGNGIEDATDIANGTAVDCNNNKRPDSCDIAFGYSQDSDNDGVLNDCEATLVSITPSTRPAALPGTVTLNATNIPAGPATLTLTSPSLPTPIAVPITLITTTGNQRTALVTLPSLFTTLTNGSADDVTCSGTLSWTNAQGSTQTTGSTANIFTFDVPEIVATTPGNAPFDQTTGVVFTLEDHVATSGVGTAKFGNLPPQAATLFSVAGMTKVVTSAPPAPAPGPVSVLLQFGGELTLETRGFVYLGPGVSSQSLTQGWQAGGRDTELRPV